MPDLHDVSPLSEQGALAKSLPEPDDLELFDH
jgi:hypothetical protein